MSAETTNATISAQFIFEPSLYSSDVSHQLKRFMKHIRPQSPFYSSEFFYVDYNNGKCRLNIYRPIHKRPTRIYITSLKPEMVERYGPMIDEYLETNLIVPWIRIRKGESFITTPLEEIDLCE